MTTTYPSKEAILRYLKARFEFEPLPHYAMVAIQICDIDEPLPRFVREHLEYLSFRFLDGDDLHLGKDVVAGTFKPFTSNQDKASDQWRRAEDCVLFLTDPPAAMKIQADRLELVEKVETLQKRGMSLFQIFKKHAEGKDEIHEELEKYYERQWRAITQPAAYTNNLIPVALLPDGEIAFRKVKTPT